MEILITKTMNLHCEPESTIIYRHKLTKKQRQQRSVMIHHRKLETEQWMLFNERWQSPRNDSSDIHS